MNDIKKRIPKSVELDNGIKLLLAINGVLLIALVSLYFMLPLNHNNKKTPASKPPITKTLSADGDSIQNMIQATLGEESPKFAVYFFRPNIDEEPFIFQSRPMQPASMIKVFIMAKIMQEVKDGNIALDEIITITPENIVGGAGSIAGEGAGARVPLRRALELMIMESDNTATNILIDRVGMANLNQYLNDNDYHDTVINHKMMKEQGKSNLSSAADLGKFFTRLYNNQCVDNYYDRVMIDYLLKQQDRDCFPAALPYWNVAHKTGEISNVYDDGGIFYGAKGDFILVIMNENIDGHGDAIDKMKKIAAQLADNFT